MKKIILTIVLMVGLLISFNTTSHALPELPEITLEEVEPLEKPKLSKEYDDMLEALKEEGWGEYKFDKDEPLPLPKVEAPKGTGKSAVDVFEKEFGDMWETRDFERLTIIPDETFFDQYSKDYYQRNLELFEAIKTDNNDQMKSALKGKLDISKYIGDSEKVSNLMSPEALNQILDSSEKPEGWSEWVKNPPIKENYLDNLDGPEGFGEAQQYDSVLDVGLDGAVDIIPDVGQVMIDLTPPATAYNLGKDGAILFWSNFGLEDQVISNYEKAEEYLEGGWEYTKDLAKKPGEMIKKFIK